MSVKPFLPRSLGSLAPSASGVATSPAVAKRAQEAAALLFFAVAAFLVLALMSYRVDPVDPAFRGADWVGPVGAAVASALVQGFGLVAWVFPLELALVGAPLLKGRWSGSVGGRVAGDLVVAIILAALVQVAFPELLVFGRAASAGNVGLLFGELMRGLFSGVGSFLVGFTLIGLVLIGRASFSFIALCRRTFQLSRRVGGGASRGAVRLGDAWREARSLYDEKRREERERAAPLIEAIEPDDAIIAELLDDGGDDDLFPLEPPPPLTLSDALSDAAEPLSSQLLEAEALGAPSAPPPLTRPAPVVAPATPAPPAELASPEPPRARSRSRREPAPSPGPLIVDTSPQQEVIKATERTARRVKSFTLPAPELLHPAPAATSEVDKDRLREQAVLLEKTLADYGVTAKVEEIQPGPTVTTYEASLQAGTKVAKVASLADDLAMGLARKVRIIAPIPGKNRVGFELANDQRANVNLRELVEDERFQRLAERAPLPVVLGRDIVGKPFYADLASLPHVIVAGATGQGKSVGLNVMLSSLLFCRTPDELRLLMVDPKVVELAPFEGIPHMLLPVVTDMKKAATALRWAVDEMERRYQLFSEAGTKNITTYNAWVERVLRGELPAPRSPIVDAIDATGAVQSVPAAREGGDAQHLPERLPAIVIVVDEFADLMMQQGKEVEASVARLAQKARAAGMHVVLATQRPSVDVITGMIKANFPSRIAFGVAQKVDSRTILDEQGAEWLLGKGDMLVKLNGTNEVRRVQCPFISEEEVQALCDHLRRQGAPVYNDAILRAPDDEGGGAPEGSDSDLDELFDRACQIVAETQRCSTSWLQRKLAVGYNRAAKLVDAMEKRGMVGPANGAKDREVLLPPPNF